MLLSRRQFIGSAAISGATMVSGASSALAGELSGLVLPPIPASERRIGAAIAPAAPATVHRVAVDSAINPQLLARARASFASNRARLRHTDVVGIADFSRPSAMPRFYLLDTNSGRVSSHLVSHGRGSDPSHSGVLQHFSNAFGSNASSNGAYVTDEFYYGKYGRSMRVQGLDRSNNNAHARAIVVHSAWYAEPDQVATHGRLGRSEGCFAMSHRSLQETLSRLGPGRFLYADKIA